MKKLYPLSVSVLLMTSRSNSSLITAPKRLCKDCKFFLPNNDKCKKFGETDLVNGENRYMYASTAREREMHCGPEATYFEPNKYKFITVPYYFIKRQLPLLAISSFTGFYLYFLATTLHK